MSKTDTSKWVCKNFCNEVLLAWFKFQAKIPSRSEVCIQGQKYTLSSPPRRTKGHWAYHEHRKSNFGCQQSYGFIFDSLWQSITKCNKFYKFYILYDSYFIAKCDRSSLQNATVITNCDNFITKCNIYYKMRRLLQIETVQC